MGRFTRIRISIGLLALSVTALLTLHQWVYSRNWTATLPIVLYPINGDGTVATQQYIDNLSREHFQTIEQWGSREAKRYQLALTTPFSVTLGPTIDSLPPELGERPSLLSTLWWGLRFRYWAWQNSPGDHPLTHVRMYVVYQQGQEGQSLPHSLGLQKGLIGLVYAYSLPRQSLQNAVVIAHELLHTVGAIDKYSPSGHPSLPYGYAFPEQSPLYPQRFTEIMAGRRALSVNRSTMASSLRHVIVNPYTAKEINWLD